MLNLVDYYKVIKLPKLDLSNNFYDKNKKGLFSKKVKGYYSYYVTDETKNKVESLFPKNFFTEDISIIAQIIDTGLNEAIHKDGKRIYALNYMIDTGGEKAELKVYDDNKNLVSSYLQKPGEWVLLNTQKYHSICNIETNRVAMSIQFFKINEKQKNYLNGQF
mgnify:CR=1 FL=1|tara:strand:- start:916 stop:1404 length:489 start_codon:yes stop_codon:yes gene_type:complete